MQSSRQEMELDEIDAGKARAKDLYLKKWCGQKILRKLVLRYCLFSVTQVVVPQALRFDFNANVIAGALSFDTIGRFIVLGPITRLC